jgi:prepilin-type processing-associated H-X9-DG protein
LGWAAAITAAGLAGRASASPDNWNTGSGNCPTFTGYQSKGGQSAGDDVNRFDTGYGMTGWPMYTEDDTSYDPIGPSGNEPNGGTDGNATNAVQYKAGKLIYGRWFKQTDYTRPAERGLVADTTFYMFESRTVGSPTDDASKYPQNIVKQSAVGASNLWQVPGQTTVDLFRHGKAPGTEGSGSSTLYNDSSGSVGFNMLYCDGHVESLSQAKEAYRALRQRFPG